MSKSHGISKNGKRQQKKLHDSVRNVDLIAFEVNNPTTPPQSDQGGKPENIKALMIFKYLTFADFSIFFMVLVFAVCTNFSNSAIPIEEPAL
jgi:hypothetical protein